MCPDSPLRTFRPGRMLLCPIALLLIGGFVARPAAADQVTLIANKDNTIFSEADDVSNGAGEFFFAGRTNSGLLRRGLVAFDASAIPSGSTVTSVTVTLYMSRTQSGTQTVSFRRLTADWGEGTSDAGGQEGGGHPAADGDATWVYRFLNLSNPPASPAWGTAGGDYSGVLSASASVGGVGFYTWGSTAGLVSDVQSWVDNPSVNFGWILIGNEGVNTTAKRFNSRQNANTSRRPSVTIVYTPPAADGACCFDDGGCQVLSGANCTSQSGSYQGDGTDCTPNPCPEPGACCLPDGVCVEELEGECLAQSGTFQGEGTTCASTNCDGACCLVGGACTVTTLDDCTTSGGSYQGFASTCTPNPCEQPKGACCVDDGSCQLVSASTCAAQNGSYSGDGTTCIPNSCPQPGACCFVDGTCQKMLESDCASNGGAFLGEGTTCSPNPCPQLGACCFNNGSCLDLLDSECSVQGGMFQGTESVCTSGLCPLILEPYVDPLPIPALAQPVSGSPGAAAVYNMAIRQFQQKLHRDLPPTTVWGFGDAATNGVYPGPTILAKSGEPVTVSWINDLRDSNGSLLTSHHLPVDPCPHGAHHAGPRTVIHLHGGHVPADVDGHPEATFLPGSSAVYTYPNHQLPGTLWYHDHALGITRLNVMMGMAGGYLITDDFEQSLGLPSGPYEIPLIIQDRQFNADGSLKYPAEWEEHFFGDTILVNGMVWPFLNVHQGKYRFRVLNGSNSRAYRLSLSPATPFVQIGTEGGLLAAPETVSEIMLSPGERIDVIIDFAGFQPNDEVILANSAPAPFPGTPGVGVIPHIMKFIVQNQAGHTGAIPAALRPFDPIPVSEAVQIRDFELRMHPEPCAGSHWMINGLGWDDITEYPRLGTTEIWRFVNRSGMSHPMHIHLVLFQVLDRQDFIIDDGNVTTVGLKIPPDASEAGWKDTVTAHPQQVTRVIARFEDYAGLYAYHCHILEHEDHEMMRQFRSVHCGDADRNGEVDLPDYSTFSACMFGPGVAPAPVLPQTPQQCVADFDCDNDGDVDSADFAAFQRHFGLD